MIDCKSLEHVDVLRGLGPDEIADIITLCHESKYEKDTIIFREGQRADLLYILAKGKIDLGLRFPSFKRRFFFMTQDSWREITIHTIPEGRSFGWSALIEPHQYTLSAHCVESCDLISIDGQKLLELCERSRNIGFHVMRNMARLISQRFESYAEQIKTELQKYPGTKW